MADDITELVRLLREKPDITSHCAASCIEGFQRKAAKVSPDPVVVRMEAEVEDLRKERDEAREAARWLFNDDNGHTTEDEIFERWPWLEESP